MFKEFTNLVTDRTRKVVEYAIEEMRTFKHGKVGTEHLLLGLLREQDGIAAQVLMHNFNLRLEDVRAAVLELLGITASPVGLPQSVLNVLNYSTSVAGSGLQTNNFPFSKSLPTGRLLDEPKLLELMTKKWS